MEASTFLSVKEFAATLNVTDACVRRLLLLRRMASAGRLEYQSQKSNASSIRDSVPHAHNLETYLMHSSH